MLDRPGFEFSFSGLKTAVAQAVRAQRAEPGAGDSGRWRADLALAVQTAIVETLCVKSLRALQFTGHRTLVVAGGVGANRALRERLSSEAARQGARVYFPRPAFCTDNAAMIGVAGLCRLRAGEHDGLAVQVRARWALAELRVPGAAPAAAPGGTDRLPT
jgi:N6-L-threonylcarbamoyladenine synthase